MSVIRPASAPRGGCKSPNHGTMCACKLCDCGKHRCGRPALPTVDVPLGGNTEYKERYPGHDAQFHGKVRGPTHTVATDAPMASATESRQQYTSKSLPARVTVARREYQPNPAALDGTTGYAADYQKWDIRPRQSLKKHEEPKNTGVFQGITTAVADYRKWDMPDRYRCPKQQYQPNPSPLDGKSSYNADYPGFQVKRVTPRAAETYQPKVEDRQFVSTMQGAFVGYSGARPQRKVVDYVPNGLRFDGISASQADYVAMPIERRSPCKPQNAPQPALRFEGGTEYSAIFTEKTAPRYHKAPQAYVPSSNKFEGISTMHSDFIRQENSRRADFSPRVQYRNEPDDRQFSTETSDKHGLKAVPVCRWLAAKMEMGANGQLQREKDGHIQLIPVASQKPTTAV